MKDKKENFNDTEFHWDGNNETLKKGIREAMDQGEWDGLLSQVVSNNIKLGNIRKGGKFKSKEMFSDEFKAFLEDFMKGDQAAGPEKTKSLFDKERQQEPEEQQEARGPLPKWQDQGRTIKDTDSARDKFKKSLGDELNRKGQAKQALRQMMLDQGKAEPDILEAHILSAYPDVDKDKARGIARRALQQYSGDIGRFNRIVKGQGHPEKMRINTENGDLSESERNELLPPVDKGPADEGQR